MSITVKEIQPLSFNMTISEYGKPVRHYSDTDLNRFRQKTKEMINDHIDKCSLQSARLEDQIKNITIQVYTF